MENDMKVQRFDSLPLDATYFTDEGYLVDHPIVTSVGIFVYSVAKLQKKKTMAELQEENEALKTKVSSLETNLDNTQMALCDVYEQLIAVTSAADKEA